MRSLSVAILCMLAVTVSAYGDYVLTPLSGGSSTAAVAGGGSFTLDLVLTSDASDENMVAIFEVDPDQSGLTYNSYTWGSPYTTGGTDDSSNIGVDPLYFENYLDAGTFGVGTIVSVSITVPTSYWNTHTQVVFSADLSNGGFMDEGGEMIDTTAGCDFTLTPEPATLVLLGLGSGLMLLRRLRQA